MSLIMLSLLACFLKRIDKNFDSIFYGNKVTFQASKIHDRCMPYHQIAVHVDIILVRSGNWQKYLSESLWHQGIFWP